MGLFRSWYAFDIQTILHQFADFGNDVVSGATGAEAYDLADERYLTAAFAASDFSFLRSFIYPLSGSIGFLPGSKVRLFSNNLRI